MTLSIPNDYGLPAELTEQAIFDKVAVHLLRQGRQSYSARRDMCAYRDHIGRACAVGCLISDDRYSPAMEGRDVQNVVRYGGPNYDYSELLPFEELLRRLQVAHDNWDASDCSPEGMKQSLANIAVTFGLSDAILNARPRSAPQAVETTTPRITAPELPEAITSLLRAKVEA